MSDRRKAVIGSKHNFWLWDSEEGYDLTHPSEPESVTVKPRVPLQTTTSKVTVDPAKTALVIIDMQNFFISPNLGRPKDNKGLRACDDLLKHAIPACRAAGIRVIWVNWGLTQEEVDRMPPATLKAFGFETVAYDQKAASDPGQLAPSNKDPRLYSGLGSNIGPVKLDDGSDVEAGRLLMRDQWNAALYPPLEEARQIGMQDDVERKDVWIHKNRMSGLWGEKTPLTEYLDEQGIKTLLFSGVNTDQCVGGSLQDAFTKGYDCLLLTDGSATTTPADQGGQACIEFNSAKTWGFSLSCKDLADGVEHIIR